MNQRRYAKLASESLPSQGRSSQRLFTRAVIPTNSLRLIYRVAGDVLDPLVEYIRASASAQRPTAKSRPHRWVIRHETGSVKVYLKYNRARCKEPFNIDEVIEALNEIPIHDLWVHELRLRLGYSLGPCDFVFRNKPLTQGSEAERWVSTYLARLVYEGWVSKTQVRHLPLIEALSVPRGGHIAHDELDNPAFIRWLSKKTGGLVKMKIVERVDETTFKDVKIRDVME